MTQNDIITQTFAARKGEDPILHFTFTDGPAGTGNVVDPSTASVIRFRMSNTIDSPDLIVKNLGDGVTVVDGPAGKADVDLAGEIDALSGSFYCELVAIDSASRRKVSAVACFEIGDAKDPI